MTDLIERYIHQVGQLLPPGERAEIEAELRSQIQDQLEDRFAGQPTEAEVASVLIELGEPIQIAASYSSDKYLVGPELYPIVTTILRFGWLIVPAIVIFLNIFGALIAESPMTLRSLIIDPLIAAVQAGFIFTGVVVLFATIVQHSDHDFSEDRKPFDPLQLPKIDDPSRVNRIEIAFGLAFGTVFILLFLYFLQVGGLTLRFNPYDPGEVIPFPVSWMVLLILSGIGQIVLQLVALQRNRRTIQFVLIQAMLEIFGMICMYFAVLEPLFGRIYTNHPTLANIPLIGSAPEVIVILFAVLGLIAQGVKLMQLWSYQDRDLSPYTVKADG